jgi:S-adenosylmethionine hydrolase
MNIITIATDFGRIDGYTATMKGVIKTIAPQVEIVDVGDDLSGILKASLVVMRYYSYYPAGTVHLVVVDPTVGSERKALIGQVENHYFTGPDNGVFSGVIARHPDSKWWSIDISSLPHPPASATFHGRDIFAPAAALLSVNHDPDSLGKRIKRPLTLSIPEPADRRDVIEGEIIDIDNFGNLITNIGSDMLRQRMMITLSDIKEPVPFVKTFSDVPLQTPLAYIGSLGYLEIAVNLGRADDYFDIRIGGKVRVTG